MVHWEDRFKDDEDDRLYDKAEREMRQCLKELEEWGKKWRGKAETKRVNRLLDDVKNVHGTYRSGMDMH